MNDKIRFSYDNDNLNIVDSRNTLLGISTYQQCCEEFSVVVTLNKKSVDYQHGTILEGYHLRTEASQLDGVEVDILDIDGGMVGIIEVTNNHNGYYSHNITFTQNGIEEDYSI